MNLILLPIGEGKKWTKVFWAFVLVPLAFAVLLWALVDALNAVDLCQPITNGWPPNCLIGDMHLSIFVTNYLTAIAYGYLPFVAFIGLLFGIIILTRVFWIKVTKMRKVEIRS